jgi:outer membrane protein OmpA-like peptidoglycan-associated protein
MISSLRHYRYIFVLFVLIGLSGCSSSTGKDGAVLQGQNHVETIDLMQSNGAATGGIVWNAAPTRYEDLVLMTNRVSRGSVEIFSLDEIVPSGTSSAYMPPSSGGLSAGDRVAPPGQSPWGLLPAGRKVPGNSSVEIFPLDAQMGRVGGASPLLPEPAFEPSPLMESGEHVTLYFEHNSTALDDADMDLLSGFSQEAKKAERKNIMVEGHASVRANYKDDAQRRIVNLRVSVDRAFAVSRVLIAEGVPAESIRVVGRGDSVPPAPVAGKTQEEAARRVELSLVSL